MSEICSSSSRKKMSPSERYSSSAAMVEGNEDLLTEILLHLPAKPLVKFKAVAKKWRSLISSPFFCHRHTLRCPRGMQQPDFIFSHSSRTTYHVCSATAPKLIAVEFNLGFLEVDIVQACNGLLLLRCRKSSSGRNYYYVYNPTTLQARDLSPQPFKTTAGVYLIFDPSLSAHYTVVCFENTKIHTLVHLYDSEAHKWKLGGERLVRKAIFHDGIYFNGGIHFLRFTSSSSRFTLNKGLSRIPPLPRLRSGTKGTYYCTYSYEGRRNSTMESNGSLFFFSRGQTNVLHIHETREVESGWTKKCEINMNPILDEGIGISRVNLLSMVLGEKDEDSLLLFTVPGKLMIYWFHGGVFEVLAQFKDSILREAGSCSYRIAHHFIHTLAPV